MGISTESVCSQMYRKVHFILKHLDSTGVSYTLHGNSQALWKEVCIDSRKCTADSFFVGLRGQMYNGGDFAHDAVNRGVRVMLVEHAYVSLKLLKKIENEQRVLICVDNACEAFEKLAHSVRMYEGKNTIVIGVTGSAGKTTTKQMLRSVLQATGSEGNLNTVQGLCLNLINAKWDATDEVEKLNAELESQENRRKDSYAVFECGISYEDEMRILARILQPDCALITNVGSSHIGNFSSRSSLQDEKLAIASHMSSKNTLWIPDDDEMLLQKAKALPCMVRTHGFKSCKDFINLRDKGVLGSVLHFENECTLTLNIPSLVNARNAITVLNIADFFSIPRQQSIMALEQCSSIARRYDIVHESPLIVDDSYNANTHAMVEAISWFVKSTSAPYLFVLGGMKELGPFSVEEHRTVIKALVASISRCNNLQRFVNIVFVGDEYNEVHLPDDYEHVCVRVRNTAEACAHIKNIFAKYQNYDYGENLCNLSVLLKGSNEYALDTVADFIRSLSQKKEGGNASANDKITTVHSCAMR